MAVKKSFKVVGVATSKGEHDVEAIVKAESADAALIAAVKKEPALDKHKDVRIYSQGGWQRVR
jgi:hypothetical protein